MLPGNVTVRLFLPLLLQISKTAERRDLAFYSVQRQPPHHTYPRKYQFHQV